MIGKINSRDKYLNRDKSIIENGEWVNENGVGVNEKWIVIE